MLKKNDHRDGFPYHEDIRLIIVGKCADMDLEQNGASKTYKYKGLSLLATIVNFVHKLGYNAKCISLKVNPLGRYQT